MLVIQRFAYAHFMLVLFPVHMVAYSFWRRDGQQCPSDHVSCPSTGHGKHARPASARRQHAPAQHLLHDDSILSTRTNTDGLHQKEAHSGMHSLCINLIDV